MLIVQIYLYIYIRVQKHVQFICVMHTCEMFFHVLVCMQWTSCVHAMDMLWIDHHCIFTCLRTCNLHVFYTCAYSPLCFTYLCGCNVPEWCILVSIHLCGNCSFHIQVCRQRCLCTCGIRQPCRLSTLGWMEKSWTLAPSANMLWVTCDLFTFTWCYLGYFIYYMGNPQTWTLPHETYCCLWSFVMGTMFTVTCAAISILLRI